MELSNRLDNEDIGLMQKVFNRELLDLDLGLEEPDRLELVAAFGTVLKNCLLGDNEMLEQLRLEGETDVWN